MISLRQDPPAAVVSVFAERRITAVRRMQQEVKKQAVPPAICRQNNSQCGGA